ncbi:MAG TPA: FtsW/RodA/SpoVE family cell cycle protein [Acidimicrobiales bacterium]|jgi:peptidoglycan glycosyltransferase|nr:FtsW/RodA/SpoVE family cell cycle protein [Acidimicrobiales bacterium]
MLSAVRRNTELGLLVLGTLVTVGAYLLASLAEDASIPAGIGPFLAVILGLQLVAHLAVRRLAPDADGTLLPIAGLLNGLGYVFIVRLDESKADPKGLAGLQAGWIAVGVVAFVLTLLIVRRVRDLERYRWTIGLVGVVLLLLPLVPGVGKTINGAKIWVGLGPISFQPGEFAKILLALFFSSYLVEKRELLAVSSHRIGPIPLPDPKHLGPVLLAWGVSLVVMVAEKDLGSSLLFFALFVALLWVSTERATYLVVGLALFACGAVFAHSQFTHVQERVDIWLDPWQDPKDDGFQIVESAFAFSAGGVTGTGINLGSPTRIPYAETDFIFAAIGEELGLVGASAVLLAFMLIIGAGLRIAIRTEVPFERLLATGLTVLIGVQSFIIMAGVIRVLPLTGVTLPFVSYGGSSLIANYVLLALLLRISDDTAGRELERAR